MPRLLLCLLVWRLAAPLAFPATLTHENWEAETAGKTIFVDFFATGCPSCMALAPMWKQLMEDYEDSIFSGVYHVDCRKDGMLLCRQLKFHHYPALRYGNASAGKKAMKDYAGNRTYEDLKAFSEELLGPPCTLSDPQSCTERDRELLSRFEQTTTVELQQQLRQLRDSFKEQEKKWRKRREQFEEQQGVFEAELKEFKSEKKLFAKAGKKLEQKAGGGGSRSLREAKEKHEKKRLKMQEKSEELEARRQRLMLERDAVEQERWSLDAKVRNSGLKLLQLLVASRGKEVDEL